ncbi:DUF6351 family protein [Piscinibacter koreensis]|uniref:DUF6351 domain-containing protein n=1 Tax=Piscinibacter koreensis TaxID=2742824 RepID=A0A7Y6NK79_9BURK|nr:DUF6351 family protein [Schlegelella koreensis]NUZ04711.1 hypothetical protein [Schlegelella koreensis]
MKHTTFLRWALTGCAAAVLVGCGGGGGSDSDAGPAATIRVLGTRADLVTSGDALVEIVAPAGVDVTTLKVDVDGTDVTSAFAKRADGRTVGLVSGLKNGKNVLRVAQSGRSGATLEITNHPRGGPVISGAQVGPWVCTTKVTTPNATNPDLGDPLDAQCNIAAPVYRYQYRTLNNTFAVYDPASPPAANQIATVTTESGRTIPYIVRIERGVINRGKYDLATLADPTNPTASWTPWAVSPAWNRKLYWKFGSGCEFGRTQASPQSVLDHVALSRGYMVASSEMTNYGSHCNDVTSAETVMMIKEHITERYGEIRFTMSEGNSGGAHQQHLLATAYPGLLQGMLPWNGWQDTWTTGREFADCGLLKRFYDGGAGGLTYTQMQRANIAGHRWNQVCEGPAQINMASRTPFYMDPQVGGADCGTHPNRWSLSNLGGIRCTLQDFNIAIFGARDATGYAKTPHDNVGIQYGLVAVNTGQITPEQFVRLNEQIGGYDINGQWQSRRMVADPGAPEIAHGSGRVAHGKGLGEVAIIAGVNYNITEEHYDFRNYVIRNRILEQWGDHANQVLWRYKTAPADLDERRFATMDLWLTRVEADTTNRTLREKIVANKPGAAVDSCYRADRGVWSTDAAYCNTSANPSMASTITGAGADALYNPGLDEWPVFRDTRVAAGEDLTSDIMKCQLKPLTIADYFVSFTQAQWSRLQAVFPNGVCDYSKPGVGQVVPQQWLTFTAGPGGKPLGTAPTSRAQ